MNNITIYLLIALAAINLLVLLLLHLRVGKLAAKQESAAAPAAAAPVTEPRVEAPPAIDPEALAAVLRRLDNRLGDIEDQVSRTPTFSAVGEAGGNSDRALALAQRLARQGATPQDIADTCGISLTEAELLHRLHAVR
jgi:hypothetical protein